MRLLQYLKETIVFATAAFPSVPAEVSYHHCSFLRVSILTEWIIISFPSSFEQVESTVREQ